MKKTFNFLKWLGSMFIFWLLALAMLTLLIIAIASIISAVFSVLTYFVIYLWEFIKWI